MRILYIAPELTNSGGIARVMALKANYFSTFLGYEVHILAPNSADASFFYEFDSKINWYSITHFGNSLRFLYHYIRYINETISKIKPDVIIICDALYWSYLPWIIKSQSPIIFETHVSTSLRKIWFKGLFGKLRFVLVQSIKLYSKRKFDRVVFETQEGSNEWNLKNSKVIPNPLSFILPKQSDLKNKKAVAVSRHSYEKGIDRLLEIWKKVIENHPDWELDICGQWDEDLRYQKMATDLQISKNVNFIAPTLEIQNHYFESSFYLMTSRSEAFGMVLIEAMAIGLPCVAYDCPCGPRSIITDHVNGFLIEDGNETDYLKAVEMLIENENLRRELGNNSLESVKKYDITTIMQIWRELLDGLVKS